MSTLLSCGDSVRAHSMSQGSPCDSFLDFSVCEPCVYLISLTTVVYAQPIEELFEDDAAKMITTVIPLVF